MIHMKHQVLSLKIKKDITKLITGTVAQFVASLTADPGVASLIVTQSDNFAEIDCKIISTVIILLPTGLHSAFGNMSCCR